MSCKMSRRELAALLEELAQVAREIKSETERYLTAMRAAPDCGPDIDMSQLGELARRAQALGERHSELSSAYRDALEDGGTG